MATAPWDEMAGSPNQIAAMDHFIQIAVHAAIDAAAQVVVSEGWPIGGTYGDVFRTLADHGVLAIDLGRRLSAATGLRNIIVHDYLDLDDRRVHAGLPQGLADLRDFCVAVTSYVARGAKPRG